MDFPFAIQPLDFSIAFMLCFELILITAFAIVHRLWLWPTSRLLFKQTDLGPSLAARFMEVPASARARESIDCGQPRLLLAQQAMIFTICFAWANCIATFIFSRPTKIYFPGLGEELSSLVLIVADLIAIAAGTLPGFITLQRNFYLKLANGTLKYFEYSRNLIWNCALFIGIVILLLPFVQATVFYVLGLPNAAIVTSRLLIATTSGLAFFPTLFFIAWIIIIGSEDRPYHGLIADFRAQRFLANSKFSKVAASQKADYELIALANHAQQTGDREKVTIIAEILEERAQEAQQRKEVRT